MPVIWNADRNKIRADLKMQVKTEIEMWNGSRPLEFEAAFGSAKGDAGAQPGREPVWVDLGEAGRIGFAGRIDRMDLSAEGGLRVVDYKTGKMRSKSKAKAPLAAGRKMQLPVYMLAARSMFPAEWGRGAEALYFHNTSAGGFSVEGAIDSVLFRELEEPFRAILRTAVSGISSGLFFPTAADKDAVCDSCAYIDICGPDIERRTLRKIEDKVRAAFDALKEIA